MTKVQKWGRNRYILAHVSTFLSVADFLALSFCSSEWMENCGAIRASGRPFYKRIVDVLRTRVFGGNAELATGFCKALRESGAYIAGSFPLQAVLYETWPGSDLDIFQWKPASRFSSIEDWLWKHCNQNQRSFAYDRYLDRLGGSDGKIAHVRIYTLPNSLSVQVVHVCPSDSASSFEKNPDKKHKSVNQQKQDRDPLVNWIDDSFDFQFCRIVLGGKDQRLVIGNTWSVVSKSDLVGQARVPVVQTEDFRRLLFESRRLKYVQRGFTLPPSRIEKFGDIKVYRLVGCQFDITGSANLVRADLEENQAVTFFCGGSEMVCPRCKWSARQKI